MTRPTLARWLRRLADRLDPPPPAWPPTTGWWPPGSACGVEFILPPGMKHEDITIEPCIVGRRPPA